MTQCQCFTAKGTQCSRNASTGSKFCYQHQDCKKVVGGSAAAAVAATSTATAAASAVPGMGTMRTMTAPIAPPSRMPVPSVKGASKLPLPLPRTTVAKLPVLPPVSVSAVTPSASTSTASRTTAKAIPRVPAADVPTVAEIAEINKTIKRINELVEANEDLQGELYVDLPSLRKYQLTMDDVKKIEQNPKQKFFMIEPQMYDEIREFGDDLEMFYEFDDKAVTGSGADLWILYKPGLLDALKAVAKRYENLPSKTVAGRRKQLGEEIYSKASFLLNDPEGRRVRAIRATKSGYPTVQATQSGLCNDLKSEMYKDELLELAQDLDLPITKNITKAELCKMIAQYAEEADIPVPEKVEEKEAERKLKKAIGVSEAEAAHNLDRMQGLSWSMGDKPEDAYEFIDENRTTVFKEFPEHVEDGVRNVLDQGQLDLVISNNKIIIDWVNPNGDDEELVVSGPVTYRKVFQAMNNSLEKFAKENDTTVDDIVGSGGHIYFEGFSPIRGKPGHFEASFGS